MRKSGNGDLDDDAVSTFTFLDGELTEHRTYNYE